MSGILYIVTTPIGNLGDLTPRAAQTLSQVDFIAAEDTRVTLRLLNHLGIKKHLVSYYEQNAREKGAYILNRVAEGETCALCTDAGMPAVSDPGEALVADAHARGLRVVPIPAASAALTALCVSGQNTSRFVFEGFLSMNRKQRAERLRALAREERTMLFYEAPHKLVRTLTDFLQYFEAGRSLTICRELTKLHEEICRTTLAQALERYEKEAPRGEFVLVVAGCPPAEAQKPQTTLEEAAREGLCLAEKENLSASEAARRMAARTPYAKSAIYRQMQKGEDFC